MNDGPIFNLERPITIRSFFGDCFFLLRTFLALGLFTLGAIIIIGLGLIVGGLDWLFGGK